MFLLQLYMSARRIAPSLLIALLLPLASHAASDKESAHEPLSLERIMRGPELYGTEPTDVRWSLDSNRVYFRWKEPGEPRREPTHWYTFAKNDPQGARPRRLTEEAEQEVPPPFDPEAANWHIDGGHSECVYERGGDIWIYPDIQGKATQVTNTPGFQESAPCFATQDGRKIAYRIGDNFYSVGMLNHEGGAEWSTIQQLTDIRPAPGAETPTAAKGTLAQINEAVESELFDSIRASAREKERVENKKKKREDSQIRKPFYLNRGEYAADLKISMEYLVPTGTRQTVLLGIGKEDADQSVPASVIPRYINDDGFVSARKGRPNVGWEKSSPTRYVLLDIGTGKATPVLLPTELKDRPVTYRDARFDRSGERIALLVVARDWHDRWILNVNPVTGAATIADDSHDDAWIGDPGWDTYGWLPGGGQFFCREAAGKSRLVLTPDTALGERREFILGGEVSDLLVYPNPPNPMPVGAQTRSPGASAGSTSADTRTGLYFTSSGGDTSQRHFFRYSLPTKQSTDLTRSLPGWNAATLSPDQNSLAVIHSYTNKPPELYLMGTKPDTVPRRVTVSPVPEFSVYPWRDVPVVSITARDGVTVRARLFTPTSRTRAAGAAVVFVHGAGYLQNAHEGWSGYPREYLFHHFLAERGYTVLDVDYRGSAGYGRDFRTGIYKNMGDKDLDDVTDCVRWLVNTRKIDPARVGIYGGSYGGFLTLMALFKEPTVYRAGAALRPVTDWSKYNDGYTSRILGLPQDDLAAYRRSSPIFFAEGLKGDLLLCHGMRDDNVFFQDTVRLTERLIELGKTDHFQTAIYPVESHAFTEPASWVDEYKRIFALFERTIGGTKATPR